MARWDNEKITWVNPDKNKIKCRTCKLRAADTSLFDGATYAFCDAYVDKPDSILFDGADCPHYVDENEG